MRESELILNPDGSVYHLSLLPGEIAPVIIIVGDPDRVPLVSMHFDSILVKKQKREFVSHTGTIGGKSITVLSTGIGADNMDIVMNELDALVNIDFITRKQKEVLTPLDIIRIGTSGSVDPNIAVDEFIISRYAIGTDLTGYYYGGHSFSHDALPPWSYLAAAYQYDLAGLGDHYHEGVTLTCPGFYAAQDRHLRIPGEGLISVDDIRHITFESLSVTNIEMETAALYLLANKLRHRAISFSLSLAQRIHGSFSHDYSSKMSRMVREILEWILLKDAYR